MEGTSLAAALPALLLGAALLLGLMLVLLVMAVRRAGRSAALAAPLARQIERLGAAQQQLAGGLVQVSEAQASSQSGMLQLMEARLADVSARMEGSLHGSSTRTSRSLGELHQKLETIDRAQAKIERLSGEVLGLQDILSNKQTRGAFGEIQLRDILSSALPPDGYSWQATLGNGKRADCLVHLPDPPGPIVIDSKFPLEAYEALRRATSQAEKIEAARQMRVALRTHIKAIASKYILPGETAEGAILFLPSEAVYAELHGNFPELVREGFEAKVWIVSPTTCMATLTTMRAILKDARMREQTGAIRSLLRQLHRDMELVVSRAQKLETHFGQARSDLEGITIAAERAGRRASKLDDFEFGEEEPPARSPQAPGPSPAQAQAPARDHVREPARDPGPDFSRDPGADPGVPADAAPAFIRRGLTIRRD
ncbi:DNA recombination protein RmuC [Profundibacterium mesophilum]|uniref:DNA recombination protein RmuC n=1 Tax=Profundibacterium mesophilum TaxID=1258573 RepID=UPI001F352D43|nr:DNA recombination protein RmuC [Profundibacterium mesophilum]